jgi:predicted ester cyclase
MSCSENGRQAFKRFVSAYRAAFPDLQMTIEDQLAEADTAATRWVATGTHRGELLGISPTNRRASVAGLTIDRIADGQPHESWNNWDQLGLLHQVGAVPSSVAGEEAGERFAAAEVSCVHC